MRLRVVVVVLAVLVAAFWLWHANKGTQGGSPEAANPKPTPHQQQPASPVAVADATPPPGNTPAASSPSVSSATPQPTAAKRPAALPQRLPDFSRQVATATTPSPERNEGLTTLRSRLPQVDVQFDPITGAPSSIVSVGRFLTPVPAAGGDAFAPVRQFVNENAALFGHDATALASSKVTRDDVTAHNGMRTVVWQQQVDGIPVYNTIFKTNLTKDGAIVAAGSSFMADAPAATQMTADQRGALVAQPPVDGPAALSLAAKNIGVPVVPDQVGFAAQPVGVEKKQNLTAAGLSDVVAKLSWLPMDATSARLTWDVTLMSTQQKAMYQVLVDVQTGEVLLRRSLTADISNASYRVYADGTTFQPFDSPAPMSPGLTTPSSTQAPTLSRTLITTPALDTTASPNGWINDGGTQTYGNNVDAHLDTGSTNPTYGNGTHAVSATRNFDFTLDLTQDPTTYQSAVVTSLFYACNYYHDKLYALGFTESAGNFQQSNFGKGGLGNDAVLADAQDGSGTNNANFSTPADGSPGRMQMYVFTGPSPHRDGDLDMEIVFHEHTHGLSNRLVGGGVGISALQTGGMGEGWSDFYGLCLLSQPTDDVNGTYAAGAYATYQLGGLTSNYYYGIRRYPYTTDMTKNPLTLKDIDPTKASAHSGVPCSPIFSPPNVNSSEVHNQGEVWCVTLWDVRANLINKLGADAGNQMVLQLVTDGMKLSPANPTFLQARDAIIQADLVDNGGANRNELWAAFAKRGMGASASVPANSTTTGVTEAFDIPDSLGISPASSFTSVGPVGGPFAPASQIYTLTNSSSSAITWSASKAQSWLNLSTTGGSLASGASVQVIAAIDATANSLLNGTYTDTITFTDVTTGVVQTRSVTLRVGQRDYFTELFSSGNDTSNQSWLFTPDGSSNFYNVRRSVVTAFSTDPTGGTALALSDDSYVQVTPTGGVQVRLYGTSYSTFYVGSNGYVTFTYGDSTLSESLSTHFNMPRISALFDDLYPSAGQVTWKQTSDRIAVTWLGVAEFGTSNSNSFQIEMFFDGRIRITCLGIAVTDGLIGLSQGLGTPADYLASDFSTYSTLQLLLAIPATAKEGDGVLAGQGSIGLSTPQGSPVTVTLTSNNTSKVTVPASVTIPAGQTSAPFDLTIIDNSVLDGTQTASITATASGGLSDSKSIAVQDNETATLSLTAPSPVSEAAGTVQGTLSVSAAPASAIAVSLSSSDTTALTVPATVTIPAGQTSVNFSITIVDDNKINGTHSATITAHVANWTDGTATVSIQDNETNNLALTLPSSVNEGGTATGTVSISGTLSTPLTVSFTSSNTSRLTTPSSVTIPAGSTSANVTLNAPDNSTLDGTANVTVTASASGFTGANRSINVLDNDPHHFSFAAIPTGQASGSAFFVTITAFNASNAVVTGFTGTVTLSASGGLTVAPPTTGAFSNGQWSGFVTVSGSGNGITLTATSSGGATGQSNTFNVAPADYDSPLNWPTFGKGPTHTAYQPGALGTATYQAGWTASYSATTSTLNQVAISNGVVYVTPYYSSNDTYLSALDASTGSELWRHQFATANSINPPTVDSGKVYIQRGNASDTQVWCLNATTGASLWSAPFGAQWEHYFASTVVGNSLWMDGGVYGGLYGFNTTDGSQRFFNSSLEQYDQWTPASYGGLIYTWIAGNFRAHDPVTGAIQWTLNLGWSWNGWSMNTAPVISSGLAFVVGSPNLYAIDLSTHTSRWSVAGTFKGTPAVANGIVYAVLNSGTAVNAYNATTGALVGTYTASGGGLSGQPIIADDSLIVSSSTATYIFNLQTFALKQSIPYGGSVSLANGIIYIAGTDGIVRTYYPGGMTTIAVALPASATEGDAPTSGTVTLSRSQSSTTTINLTASDSSRVTIPASVTIPAGQTSATFSLAVIDDALLNGPKNVTITARADNYALRTGTAGINIFDNEAASLALNAPATAAEGTTFPVTVTLSGAPVNDVTVSISSNDRSELFPPASVVIRAGQTSAVFNVQAVEDGIVDGSQTATLTAHVQGWTDGTAAVTVLDSGNNITGGWPTFGNGPAHTGYQPLSLGGTTYQAGWTATYPGVGLNQVAVGNGMVFVTPTQYFGNTFLSALDASAGNELWRDTFASSYSINPPTFDAGKVYTQKGKSTTPGNDSQLYCVDAATGTITWIAPFGAQWESYLAPTVAAGGVWVDGGYYGGLYGFNSSDGSQRFFNSSLDQYDEWTPAYYGGTVYTWVAGKFRAHDPNTGAILWSLTASTGNPYSVNSAPAIDQGLAFVVGYTNFCAIDLTTHAIAWTPSGSFKGSAAVANGVVYGISGSNVQAYDTQTGALLGTYSTSDSNITGQPIVTNDTLVVSSSSKTYLFNLQTFALTQTLPYGGTVSLANRILYIAGTDGVLRTYYPASLPLADLAISQTLSPQPAPSGSTVTITLNVTNNGPTTAYSSTVRDPLPPGLTYLSAVSTQGTCSQSGGVVTCSLGDMANGAAATVTITATSSGAGNQTNTATVTSPIFDPTTANNSSSVTFNGVPPSVTTLAATGIYSSYATLNGSINPNGGSTTASFEYGLTTSYGTSTAATPSTISGTAGTTAISSTIYGLSPNTTYHYRAKGVNIGGTGYGSDATFRVPNNVSSLSNLAISAGTLAPVFSSGTTNYTAGVTNATTSITVSPTTTDPNATVTVNGTPVASGTASAPISLAVGNNYITVICTAENTSYSSYYYITVARASNSADANLTNLALSSGTLTPVFSSGTTNYTATVSSTTTSITVTPTVSDPAATVKVNGIAVSSGSASGPIALASGPNVINTVVTAADGTSTKAYTVTVTRLTPITVADGSMLVTIDGTSGAIYSATYGGHEFFRYGTFVSDWGLQVGTDTTTFRANTANSTAGIPVTMTGAIATGTYTAGGQNVAVTRRYQAVAGHETLAITNTFVNNGASSVTLRYFDTFDPDQGNSVNGSYTTNNDVLTVGGRAAAQATITASPQLTCLLTGINISSVLSAGGAYFQINSGATLNTVFTTPADDNGALSDNGLHLIAQQIIPPGGTWSFQVLLSFGATVASAQNNLMLSYPPPVVTTLAATNVTGTSATVNGTINANGNSTTASFDYGTSVSYSANIVGTPSPVTGIGNTAVSATLTGLTPGTTYHFRVNGASAVGTTNGTDLTFTTPSNDANLSNLTLSSGTLNPAFTSSTMSYTASVSNATTTITLTPTVANSGAGVKVNGSAVTSGTPSGAISLAVGSNTVTTLVTAQDGLTTKTYSIAVTRRTPYQDWATGLGLNGAALDPMGDFNGNGLKNILKWAFATNSSSGGPVLGPIKVNGSTLVAHGVPAVFTPDGVHYYALFGRRKDAATVGLTYQVVFSNTLSGWTTSTDTPTIVAQDSEIEAVTVPFPAPTAGQPQSFFHVNVTGQ